MELIRFPGHNVIYAEHQEEYRPLPARRLNDREGSIVCCWRLSWRERFRLLLTGSLWHTILTFHQPLQPQLLSVEKPEMNV